MPCRTAIQVEQVAEFIYQSYENNCKLRVYRGNKKTPWWNSNLEKARRETRKHFNKAMRTKITADWDNFKESQRNYKDLIRRSKREAWWTFCGNVEGLPEAARLQNVLFRGSNQKAGTLRLPSGRYTSTAEETLSCLMENHFPGSGAQAPDVRTQAALRIGSRPIDWKVAARVVPENHLKWP